MIKEALRSHSLFQAGNNDSLLEKSYSWCLCWWSNSIWQFTIPYLEIACQNGILKLTVKSLGRFYILVKLQAGSLQLKNELIHRHFVEFCLVLQNIHGNIFTAFVDFE